jgi:hypothetical protein
VKGIRSNIKRAVLLPKKDFFFFADFTFAKLFSQFGSFADILFLILMKYKQNIYLLLMIRT